MTRTAGFVHLHTHSECSELDSVARVADLVAAAAHDGQPALALTDHGSLSGLWTLHAEATKYGIKPIAGLEAYVAIGSRHEQNHVMVPADDADPDAEDTDDGLKRKTYEHLTVLAINQAGWRNLVGLHLEANKSRWGKHPRIDYDLLAEHAEGLVVLTGCLAGPVMGPLARAHRLAIEPALWAARDATRSLPEDARAAVRDALRRLRATVKTADWSDQADRDAIDDALHATLDTAADVDAEDALADSLGELAQAVKRARNRHAEDDACFEQARAGLRTLIDAVGHDNVYVELMEHGIGVESAALPALVGLAREFDLPVVATNDAHHTHAEDAHAHEAWLALQTGARLSDPPGRGKGKRFVFNGSGYHLRTEEEMRALRPEPWWQEACDNTVALAERVADDVLPERKLRLPRFPVPEGFRSSKAYLKHLVTEGAKARYGDPYPKEVADRLTYEFGVLTHFKIWDYFLILHELVTWCRQEGILVGAGRGSAAGSAVAYVLGLTNVDPIRYGLLFERFLDPTRVGMPDIDTDFEQGALDRIREHLVDTYGHERVVRIGTFAFARSKAAIKDAARVLGVDPQAANKVSKAIPVAGGKPAPFQALDARGEDTAGFWDAVADVRDGEEVVDLARSFEGVIKGRGIHACGTVIADEDLTRMVPLRTDTKSALGDRAPLVTEWDADGISEDGMGLLKLDVLGLRNLDIIAAALRNIEAMTGEVIDPVHGIPDPDDLSDPRVQAAWDLLGAGRTSGVFQLESPGMTRLAQDVVPTSMEHMSALVALYRPGPLSADMHVHYAARKNGREPVDYGIFTDDPAEQEVLERVLGATYALTVYQETMMQLGDEVAGFTVVERNRLRKAISKKKKAEIAEFGELFLVGAASRYRMAEVSTDTSKPAAERVTWDTDAPKVAFSPATAKKVWATIEGAGDYAFNKSHSLAYGYVSFVTAYLKANWPAAFTAAVLGSTDDKDRRALTIRSAAEEGLRITPPDLNNSGLGSTPVDPGTVALGLSEIKDVGDSAVAIVAERDANGPFTSVADLMRRVPQVNTVVARALIEAGACDGFGPRLGQVRTVYGSRKTEVPVPREEWGVLARAARQHDRLGLSVGRHPMSALTEQVKGWRPDLTDMEDHQLGTRVRPLHRVVADERENFLFATVGMVTRWEVKPGHRGMRAEVVLEGSRGALSAVVWDDALRALRADGVQVGLGTVLGVLGRARTREFEHTRTVIDPDTAEEVEETVTSRQQTVSLLKVWPVPVQDVGEEHVSEQVAPVVNLADYLHGGERAGRRPVVVQPQEPERQAVAAGSTVAAERPRLVALDGGKAPRAARGSAAPAGGDAAEVPTVVTRRNWQVLDVESAMLRGYFFDSAVMPEEVYCGPPGGEPVVLRVARTGVPSREAKGYSGPVPSHALVVAVPAVGQEEAARFVEVAEGAAAGGVWEPYPGCPRWERLVSPVSWGDVPAHTAAEAA